MTYPWDDDGTNWPRPSQGPQAEFLMAATHTDLAVLTLQQDIAIVRTRLYQLQRDIRTAALIGLGGLVLGLVLAVLVVSGG